MGKNVLNSMKQFSLIFLVLCILNHSTATARANGLETDELNEAWEPLQTTITVIYITIMIQMKLI